VGTAESSGAALRDLDDGTIREALAAAGHGGVLDPPGALDGLRTASGIDGALAAADVAGGTAPARVREALRAARARLERDGASGRGS
jgi:hypothetical protein